MFAIIGLGNPGIEYERTRHNVGFRVIDALSSRFNIGLMAGGEEYSIGTGTYQEAGFFIVKPLTFMNGSGWAVAHLVQEQALPLGHMLVVCDDSNLPLGKIRIRRSGSNGGHKGLTSIIDCLQTEAFPRLRVGIGHPPPEGELIDYVLEEFDAEEEIVMGEAILRATEAILCVLSDGLERAMNTYN